MKKMKCSGCLQVLGVPRKFFGKKVTCPNCQRTLVVNLDGKAVADKNDQANDTVDDTAAELAGDPVGQLQPATSTVEQSQTRQTQKLPAVPLPKFGKAVSLRSLPRPDSTQSIQASQLPATDEVEASDSGKQRSKEQDSESNHGRSDPTSIDELSAQPAIAKIISVAETHLQLEQLESPGELPTLRLKEDQRAGPRLAERKSNPVLLGVLVCGSLIISGLILVFGDFQPKVDQRVVENARQELTRFYSVRIDTPMKPYQIHLREAQLAHSRGDRQIEIESYRKVMRQFRAEDRNQYVGVTGSPTADAELEHLVSIMLGNGQDQGGIFR